MCDSTGYFAPLLYPMNEIHLHKAIEGYTHRDKYYPGVKEIVKDLTWAVENDIWNISRENYINKGVAKLN